MNPIVLAYRGDFDASLALAWLVAERRADVVTLTVDLGQSDSVDGARERALSLGAVRAHVIDARDPFAREFVLPSLHADALAPGGYPSVRELGHSMVAKALVEAAALEGAREVVHTSAGAPHAPVSFAERIRAIDPALAVTAATVPSNWTPALSTGGARPRGVMAPRAQSTWTAYSNLWGRVIRRESPGLIPVDAYRLTHAVDQTPESPAVVEIAFVSGEPVSVNGVPLLLIELIANLETIAGAHGVGRLSLRDDAAGRPTVYEVPAAVLLHTARRAVADETLSRTVRANLGELAGRYVELAVGAPWPSAERRELDARVGEAARLVNGTARLECVRGACRLADVMTKVPSPRRVARARLGTTLVSPAGSPAQ